MDGDNLQKLLNFLNDLTVHGIFFRLERHRDEAVMVLVDVPGERWEVEFFADGGVEIEIFRSDGRILSGDEAEKAMDRLITDFGD